MSDELIALAREDVDAFNAGDWGRMRARLGPDSVYDEPATGRRLVGADAIIAANEGWKAAFPDARGTITGAFAAGDRVVVEVTWNGTQTGTLELAGGTSIPATGRTVTMPACQIHLVRDGRIVETRHFFDMLGMLTQLGAISERELAHV